MVTMVTMSVFMPVSLLLFTVATPPKSLEELMGKFVNGFFKVPGFSARIHRSCLLGGIRCLDGSGWSRGSSGWGRLPHTQRLERGHHGFCQRVLLSATVTIAA